jgi:RimJ/RimL family protein N-acetyltransferase
MPERIELGDGFELRRANTSYAVAIAGAVAESLAHLRPFLPWADDASTRPEVQHNRLLAVEHSWDDGRDFQYVIIATAGATPGTGDGGGAADERVVGMIGAMHPDRSDVGRDAVELGYWVHVDWCCRGLATRASRAVANATLTLEAVERIVITVDEANAPSNAVPRRLGYTVAKVIERPPAAPGETGRMQVWVGGAPAGDDHLRSG